MGTVYRVKELEEERSERKTYTKKVVVAISFFFFFLNLIVSLEKCMVDTHNDVSAVVIVLIVQL